MKTRFEAGRRRPWVLGAILLLVTPCLTLAGSGLASAFDFDGHGTVTRAALAGSMSEQALFWVVGDFYSIDPSGNLGSDWDWSNTAQHYDNASSPAAICERWRYGQDTYLNRAVASLKYSLGHMKNSDRAYTLRLFGRALHALQDFYSHSNWVEILEAFGESPRVAPLSHSCEADALPQILQTGYFEPSLENGGLLWGCPKGGKPPQPFAYCHTQLAKDSARTGHGSETTQFAGILATYHTVAAALAIEASRQLWQEFRERVIAAYSPSLWSTEGECVFESLARGPGPNDGCFSMSGLWKDGSYDVIVTRSLNTVSGDLVRPYSCPYGGQITNLFTVELGIGSLIGHLTACNFDRQLVLCGISSVFQMTITEFGELSFPASFQSPRAISVGYRPLHYTALIVDGTLYCPSVERLPDFPPKSFLLLRPD